MKVSELIEALGRCDPELEVLIPVGMDFRIVDDVGVRTAAPRIRLPEYRWLAPLDHPNAKPYVVLLPTRED